MQSYKCPNCGRIYNYGDLNNNVIINCLNCKYPYFLSLFPASSGPFTLLLTNFKGLLSHKLNCIKRSNIRIIRMGCRHTVRSFLNQIHIGH